MTRTLSTPVLLLLAAAAASAQTQAKPSPLNRFVQEALTRNLRLLAERYRIPMAEAQILQARLRPNPTLLLQWQYLDVFGLGFNENNPAGPPEGDVGVILPIVRGGKRAARIEEARWSKSAAESDFLNATRQLILDVQMAYVDFLVLQDNMQLYQASEAAFRDIVAAKREQVALRFQYSKYRMQTLVGRTTMDPAFDIQDDFEFSNADPDFKVLKEAAIRNRPDLKAARREAQRAQAYLQLQRANAKHDHTLYAWYNRQYGLGIQNGSSMTFTWYVPLQFSDRNQGEIARAQEQISQAQARVRQFEQQITEEVAVMTDRYRTTASLVRRIENEMLGKAREARDTIRSAYERNEATLVEFLDAQRAFIDASLAWNDARAEHARTLFLMEALTGTGRVP
jgi:cobalt-zinc-cadmium efflux system outer membrane protein